MAQQACYGRDLYELHVSADNQSFTGKTLIWKDAPKCLPPAEKTAYYAPKQAAAIAEVEQRNIAMIKANEDRVRSYEDAAREQLKEVIKLEGWCEIRWQSCVGWPLLYACMHPILGRRGEARKKLADLNKLIIDLAESELTGDIEYETFPLPVAAQYDLTIEASAAMKAQSAAAIAGTSLPEGMGYPRFVCVEGAKRKHTICKDGSVSFAEVCRNNAWVPLTRVCSEGAKRGAMTCKDGSVIHAEVCRNDAWVPTGGACPTNVCSEGAERYPTTCGDKTMIHAEVCRNDAWVPSGETCPTKVYNEGDMRNPTTCGDGSVIYAEVYRNNAWVPSGGTCPTEADAPGACTFGGDYMFEGATAPTLILGVGIVPIGLVDTVTRDVPAGVKAGASITVDLLVDVVTGATYYYIDEIVPSGWTVTSATDGGDYTSDIGHVKWVVITGAADKVYSYTVTVPAVPGPVPPVEPVPYVPPVEPVPYVPPVEPTPYQPVPPVIPPADGMFTIEFQEMIPGVTPPRVPLLVPGLETLPLLPGWIVRDAAGNIVNKGMELPTLQEIENQ